jgi:hypothetical protein
MEFFMFKKTVLVSLVVFSTQFISASQQSAQAPSSPVATRRVVCPDAPARPGKMSRTAYSYATVASTIARLRFVKRVVQSNFAYNCALNSADSQSSAAQ